MKYHIHAKYLLYICVWYDVCKFVKSDTFECMKVKEKKKKLMVMINEVEA